MTQQTCEECGALVESAETHAQWHQNEKDRIQDVVNETVRRTGLGG